MEKTILFDLDGTLTDSGEGILKSAVLGLEHFGLPIPSVAELRTFVGPPLPESFMRFGVPRERTEEAVRVFRERYLTIGKFENHPYPGIPELLGRLKACGNPLMVATSKPEALAIEVLEHFALAQYFTCICGATFDGSRVNKADVIAYLLEKSCDAARMVMVGDTNYDILGAACHGIPAIGVAWGYGNVEDMKKAGAAAIAQTPEELFDLLQAI